jgi:FkbM family methyltransferase
MYSTALHCAAGRVAMSRHRLALTVQLLSIGAAAVENAHKAVQAFLKTHNFSATHGFIEDLAGSSTADGGRSSSKHVVVFDVGSNDGRFSYAILDALAAIQVRRVDLVMYEPQALLNTHEKAQKTAQLLKKLQMDASIEVVHKAAWLRETNLTFHRSAFSESSSLIETQARVFRRHGTMVVETVDIAAEVHSRLARLERPERTVFFKLDVEGAEYDVLSYLLTRGTLCLLDYILVEWHLNSMDSERRLAALGLQLSLDATLQRGCPETSRPRIVTSNAEDGNNVALSVPGLAEEASRHVGRSNDAHYNEAGSKWRLVHRRYGTDARNATNV